MLPSIVLLHIARKAAPNSEERPSKKQKSPRKLPTILWGDHATRVHVRAVRFKFASVLSIISLYILLHSVGRLDQSMTSSFFLTARAK